MEGLKKNLLEDQQKISTCFNDSRFGVNWSPNQTGLYDRMTFPQLGRSMNHILFKPESLCGSAQFPYVDQIQTRCS